MIFDIVIATAGLLLRLFAFLFGFFQLPGLSKITDAIVYFFGYLNYIGIMFPPLYDILNACGIVLSFFVAFYSLKIVLYLWGMLPWIGKHAKLPSHK